MRIELKRMAARIDRTLTDIFPPAPNGQIVGETGGAENEYGEQVATDEDPIVPTSIKVWILISKGGQGSASSSRSVLRPGPAGSADTGLFEFTARGTTRHPIVGDVIQVDGETWRVTGINPDSPSGNYVDGFVERMA